MKDEIGAYVEYLLNFRTVNKPPLPKFDVSAYTDNEYQSLVLELMNNYALIDDEYLTINYLKGL